ncbi:hypothetical protein EDB89DRAFT_1904056 [Lactarius sanguifluus]|nr:hypothetical protein EDB89DRAFT_1904056 [Lactarius sanguifluus]
MDSTAVYVASVVLAGLYGYKVRDMDHTLVRLMESCDMFRTGFQASAGNSWEVSAEKTGELLSTHHSSSFGAEGLSYPGDRYLSTFVDGLEGMTEREEDLVEWAASIVMDYLHHTFFLAVALRLYPEAQRKAQEGHHAVMGLGLIACQSLMTAIGSHTSMLSSRRSCAGVQRRFSVCCTHVACLLLCSLAVAVLLAGPHRLICDDEKDGYFIPEGIIVIANVWGLLRDASVYSNPLTFNLECFVASETTSVEIDLRICFGFGRRVRITEGSPFLYFATTLAMYQISNVVDESGTILEPTAQYASRLIRIKPRSEQAVALKSLPVTDGRHRSSMLRVKDDFPITTEAGWNNGPSVDPPLTYPSSQGHRYINTSAVQVSLISPRGTRRPADSWAPVNLSAISITSSGPVRSVM